MARIPVERDRKGSPWWLWLVGLLVIAALAWLLTRLFDPADTESDVVEGDTTAAMSGPVGAGDTGTITDATMLFAAGAGGTLAGREVNLESVQVADVVGDSTFFISNQGVAPGTGGDLATPATPALAAGSDTTSDATRGGAEARSGGSADRILVLMDEREDQGQSVQREGGIKVTEGKAYRLQGRVEQFQENMLQNRGLGRQELDMARQSGIFIRASQVEETTAPGGGSGAKEEN